MDTMASGRLTGALITGRGNHRAGPLRLALGVVATVALMVASASFARPVEATFGGHDGLVAFSRGESSGKHFRAALYTMNPDGTATHRLTRPGWGFVDTEPHWSPDGTQIAFERDDLTANNADIYLVSADGSSLTRLTRCSTEPGCGGYFGPTWTPDGRSIVLTRCCVTDSTGDHQGIYVMRSDGTAISELTFNADPNGGDNGPTVSPDGRWVAFSRQVADPNGAPGQVLSAMFLVHLNGTGLHPITSYDLWVDEKDWSPDGSRIVFVSHAGSNTGPFRADIESIAPDGTGLTKLTSTTPGQTFAFAPVWSPSGQRIMFDFFPATPGTTAMFTMRRDGSDVQPIAGTSGDNWPSWGTAPTR